MIILILLYLKLSCAFSIPYFQYHSKSDAQATPDLIKDFKTYITFAKGAMCSETWLNSTFPKTTQFEVDHPTLIIKSAFSPNTTGAGFVAVNHQLQNVIVSFRGSATKRLWLSDLEFWKQGIKFIPVAPIFVPHFKKNARVHDGFQKVYLTLKDQLQPAIKEAADKYPTYKIVFAGHSLGSALAVMGAVDFTVNNPSFSYTNRISIYAFATPRIGNQVFAEYLDSLPFSSRSFRIVKYGDPGITLLLFSDHHVLVPRLPPDFYPFNYKHAFQQFNILPNNTIVACKTYDECSYNDILQLRFKTHLASSYLDFLGVQFYCTRNNEDDDIFRNT